MNRSIAIAYTVASAATAIALVVLIGSTVGFGGAFSDDDDDDRVVESSMTVAAPVDPRQLTNAANAQAAVGASTAASGDPVIVYEDAPQARGGWREDEGEEEEEHERGERGERGDD